MLNARCIDLIFESNMENIFEVFKMILIDSVLGTLTPLVPTRSQTISTSFQLLNHLNENEKCQ